MGCIKTDDNGIINNEETTKQMPKCNIIFIFYLTFIIQVYYNFILLL